MFVGWENPSKEESIWNSSTLKDKILTGVILKKEIPGGNALYKTEKSANMYGGNEYFLCLFVRHMPEELSQERVTTNSKKIWIQVGAKLMLTSYTNGKTWVGFD